MTTARWRTCVRALLATLDQRGDAPPIASDEHDEVRLPRALFLELLKRPPSVAAQSTAVLVVMVARLEADAAAGRDVPTDLAELCAARDDVLAELEAWSCGEGETPAGENLVVH